MKVIDRTKAVTQHFLENSFKKLSIKKKSEKHKNIVLNLTYLHCLQHSLFEHLLNLYSSLEPLMGI